MENYTLMRFPERRIRFINAGRGGETAHGVLTRLKTAVFDQGATVLTVAYGVNDIGWGTKADAEHKAQYLDAIGSIVEQCKARGVRVFICSVAITAEEPDKAEKGFLQTMCDEGLALAKGKGAGTIDIMRSMRSVQRRVLAANEKEPDTAKHTRLHVSDGVHLNELGQFAMAHAILKGLGAPADSSAAELDAEGLKTISTDACRITNIRRDGDRFLFTRTDDRQPMNLAPLWVLHGFYVPLGELNHHALTVKNLPPGKYVITTNGRALGAWSADALGKGVNIASASADPWQPASPWAAQGYAVKALTDARDRAVEARKIIAECLDPHPRRAELLKSADELDARIVELQRAIAKPEPVNFVIAPAPDAK